MRAAGAEVTAAGRGPALKPPGVSTLELAFSRGHVPRSSIALLLIVTGVVLVLLGVLVWSGALSRFGRLPGDIRVERPNVRVYVPITSMVLLSVVLSLLIAIVQRFR